MKMRAVFIGRFQPFHKGHLAVVKKMSRKYRLIILIGSTNRKSGENPFPANLRKKMIRAALKDARIKNVRIVAMPDTKGDKLWTKKFLELTKNPDMVITGNPWVARCLKDTGVKFLKIKEKGRKISATKIRAAMRAGKPWQNMAPKAVVKIISRYPFK
ncbi:adenylyltransferase/cytidyltransferase family protein [Candidatus Uhrbacteria bacterium]|nr:adenylyltransferase/cytidyltransferase family protein [Candidatus Uhrbacteria bacterium]